MLSGFPCQSRAVVRQRYAYLCKIGARQESNGALVYLQSQGSEDEVKRFNKDDLVNEYANIRHMQPHGHDYKVCDRDVGDEEHPIAPSPYKGKSCRADCGKQNETGDAPNDVPVFDAFCEEARNDEEVEVEDSMQGE